VPVTDEQRAMLQLLLEGGQGYDDIGSLLGIAPDEVRSRARSALTEIGGADPDAQVGLSDYLLGQADPIGRADAVRHLQNDPEANALAQRLVQNLRLLAPRADLPEIPEPRGGRRAVPAPPPAAAPPPASASPTSAPPAPPAAAAKGPGVASRAAGFFSGLGSVSGKRRTQLIVGGATALVLVIVVIVLVSSGGGGGGNTVTLADGSTKNVSSSCKPVDITSAKQAGIPTMALAATGSSADADCPPSGQLTLGSIPQTQRTKSQSPTLAIQANAVDVPAAGTGNGYLLWLYKSDTQAVPLGPLTAGSGGNLSATIPLPTQELVLFPAFDKVRVSKVTTAQGQQIQQSLNLKGKKPSLLVPFVGNTVLEGTVSDLGIQQLLQQAQSQSQSQGQAPTGTGTTSGSKG
jgi:hypothetical protein